MTRRASRVAHLEAHAARRTAAHAARLPLALRRLSDAHLEELEDAVNAAGGTGLPVRPWEDPHAALTGPERAAWQWAARTGRAALEDVWTPPPVGAAAVFQVEAARLKDQDGTPARHARAAWALMAALAAVTLEERDA